MDVWPNSQCVVARSGQGLQSLADRDPTLPLYESGGQGWHGDALCRSLYLPAGHAEHATHDAFSAHSVPAGQGWQSCSIENLSTLVALRAGPSGTT